MNIAVLCYHRVGGSGIVAFEIGCAMSQRGHTVHFVGIEPPFRFGKAGCDRLRFHKVNIYECPVFDYTPYILATASQLSEIIAAEKIDVIHSHYALPHAVAAHLARDISGRQVRCITTLHGTDVTMVGADPSLKSITRHTLLVSDVVTAVSHFLRKETETIFDVPSGRIYTVYNFVNTAFFNPGMKSQMETDKALSDKGDKAVVLHMSNLRPVKAPLDVIRIFRKLLERVHRPLELWIVGEGPLQGQMRDFAAALGIAGSVRFFGARNEVGPLLANADLFLLPSDQESFGLAALEAMACGVPVVATRAGGLPEVIEDGVSGALFDKGDIEAGAERAAEILVDRDLAESMRAAAFEIVNGRFREDAIIDRYEQLYTGAPCRETVRRT